MYALYNYYNFSMGQIGQLFIAGFGSSMIFGTIVGSLADRYGRKLNCIIFVILYSISCMTKHSPDFNVLMVGRLLGGISTSILYSAFETWMIHEHKSVRGSPVVTPTLPRNRVPASPPLREDVNTECLWGMVSWWRWR